MRKWTLIFFLSTFLYFQCTNSFAVDLIEVYCRALSCDPTFKREYADLLVTKENVPINRAALFPKVDFHADAFRQRLWAQGLQPVAPNLVSGVFVADLENESFYNNSTHWSVTLVQPIFNYTAWAKVKVATAAAKQAEAKFCAAAQDLMIRTVTAYFNVIVAYSELYYTIAQKKAISRQVLENRERHFSGISSITAVYEAQASYDIVSAREQNAYNNLASALEDLKGITNAVYCSFKGICYLPLIKPDPKYLGCWLCLAEQQNYALLAACYAVAAAKENIKVEFGGHLPVINAIGDFNYSYDSNPSGIGIPVRINRLEGGVSMDMPLYRGGGINARTIQAHYLYQKAVDEQEITHRDVITKTGKAYFGILARIREIHADKEAIQMGEKSLDATQVSYRIGTRTILDVLNVQTQLYESYKSFVRNQYDYILRSLQLKQEAGTLCVEDLQIVNCWLQKNIDLSCYIRALNE